MSEELNRELFYAASCGYLADCQRYIDAGGTVSTRLFSSTLFKNFILLVNINWKNREAGGATALIAASQNNRLDVVDLLQGYRASAAKQSKIFSFA